MWEATGRAHRFHRAQVHLRGAELQPGALGARSEVGSGKHGEAERVAVEAEGSVEVVDHDRDVAVSGDGDGRCTRGHDVLPSVDDQSPRAYSSASCAQLSTRRRKESRSTPPSPRRPKGDGRGRLRGCRRGARRRRRRSRGWRSRHAPSARRSGASSTSRVVKPGASVGLWSIGAAADRRVRPTWRARTRRRRAGRRACRSPSRAPRWTSPPFGRRCSCPGGSRRARRSLSVCGGMLAASSACTRSTAGTSRVFDASNCACHRLSWRATSSSVARDRRDRRRRRRRRAARPVRRRATRRCSRVPVVELGDRGGVVVQHDARRRTTSRRTARR